MLYTGKDSTYCSYELNFKGHKPTLQDEVYYSQGGDATDLEYFYVNPTNGVIRLRKSLTGSVRNTFTFTVRAIDNRPQGVQKSTQATVQINVLRDGGPPQFVNTPYRITVPINQAVNSSFFSVRAVDNDLKVILISTAWCH
ncbi:hypothetical protein DPMN_036504 [Dreissena polymorpha]|uniref:Cadherin domain-containing protein n=1 Tax=Dreissena polymorpha TaxID=45954 RepID=A0A9D4MB04_DREPO|nr:hypothetical protein DPMN_036504 [Dreissena polymorpha]